MHRPGMKFAAAATLMTVGMALSVACARAATIEVANGQSAILALSRAAPGDTLHLAAGTFQGDVVVALPGLTIEGDPGAVVVGSGTGDAMRVTAPDVTIRGLTIRGSGMSLIDKNSGIFLDRTADRALVADNRLEDNLISVYLDGPHDAVVRDNHIQGLRTLRRTERGPAISLWNTPGSRIIDNDIRSGRDGVFSVSSSRNVVRGNSFHDLRFAVHFMYTNDSEVAGNLSEGNEVGYVMMYSDRLRVHDNVSDHDRDHGVLFNYANASRIEGNVVRGSEKCVFFYNASKNRFADNWFEGCQIGIHFTAGSERNEITGNAFVGNRIQVMYVGTQLLDWSVNGRGNYYSDNPAFDLNGDGIADTAYRPNDLMDQVIWRAPAAKLLLNSPATQVVRWAQAQFPALHPGGVIDTAPLMAPVRPHALARLAP
ncbi:MAG: nitrous oxide reductase family maturation protein NosD [Rhodopila sp.]|nr:nitrous oxide reductase family maturation protein NosD [Rhodopila sp.]